MAKAREKPAYPPEVETSRLAAGSVLSGTRSPKGDGLAVIRQGC